MLRLIRNGTAACNVPLPNSRRRVFFALLFIFLFAANLIHAQIYQYRDEHGRRVFTNECNAEHVKAGCTEFTLKEKPRLSLEEEKRLRALFPGSDQIDQIIKETRRRSKTAVRPGNLHADINGDGRVTIGDVPGWVQWVFKYPGEWLVSRLPERNNKWADFLELRDMNYSAYFPLWASVAFWLAVCILCFGIKRAVQRFRAKPRYLLRMILP